MKTNSQVCEEINKLESKLYKAIARTPDPTLFGDTIEIEIVHDCTAHAIGLNDGALADWIDARAVGRVLAANGYTWHNSDEPASTALYKRV